ncbi:MAG TPA: methyltransferase, partial [Clostridia bacterium]|nr:methyltransferase [Clostridia bacterium]
DIAARKLLTDKDDFRRVVFVAMNRAAEARSYQWSANYLATLLASTFRNSEAIAYTPNDYDKQIIDEARLSVDILLCSAGSHAQSYLDMWLKNSTAGGDPMPQLPQDYVGDFCLTPIDAAGHALQGDVAKAISDRLDPYPRFQHLSELGRNERCTIIFPVNVGGELGFHRSGSVYPTGKEVVAKAILRSGIVSVCVLEKPLASNLVQAVGDYLLAATSKVETNRPVRLCTAFPLVDEEKPREIYVHDPCGRLDSVCAVDPRLSSKGCSSTIIPKIIISEMTREASSYDWSSTSGQMTFRLDECDLTFALKNGVRKPGHFSLTTLQFVLQHIEDLRKKTARGLSLWDMGCGSGFVGLVAAKLSPYSLKSVFLSDLNSSAVECARENYDRLKLSDVDVRYSRGNLFEANAGSKQYDVIAFNPPFLPEGLPQRSGIDCGGRLGVEIPLQFCEELPRHLTRGGRGIVAVADYVDDGRICRCLKDGFGADRVTMEERLILYPLQPVPPIPQAYEVSYKEHIEKLCNYHFERCLLGQQEYLGFKMRHYIAQR